MTNVATDKSNSPIPGKSEPPPVTPTANTKCKQKKMKLILKIVLYGVGAVLLTFGIIITGFWEHLYRHILVSKLVLSNSESSQSYASWNNDAVPIYFKVYLFNLTNPTGVALRFEKPRLDELGPYVYRIRQVKDDITWNSNSTVTFRDRRRWDFDEEKSVGSLNDRVVSINAVALTLINACQKCSIVEKIFLNSLLKFNEKFPFISYTVEDVLFKGADDKMLDMIRKLKKYIKPLRALPDKFAWYYGKNMTETNIFNIYTGESDINKLGLLHSWNYKTHCNVYTGECDQVRGSVGDLWPMNAAEEGEAPLFISDFCSNFPLTNVGPNSVHDVKGTKFEGTKDLFNGSRPEASCFCPNNECEHKPGVRDVSACLKAPVFVSFPHFYAADRSYLSAVSGLNPIPDKHKFHFTLQEDSGIVIDIFARLQINVLIESIPGFDFINIPKVYLPILWFEETAEVPPELIAQLQFSFNTLPFWFSTGGLILAIIGTILLVSGLIITRLNLESIPYTRRLE